MSNHTITGAIKLIFDTQTFASGFSKREFVVTTEGEYPKHIKLEFLKDKCQILDSYKVDDEVEVCYNLNGSEYNGKYYVNLLAWKITHLGEHQDQRSAPITTNTLRDEVEIMHLDEMEDCPF